MKTMLDYISCAPAKMKEKLADDRWCEGLAEFMRKAEERLVIVASGSSCNAANCAKIFLQKTLDIEIEVITPYTFGHYYTPVKSRSYLLISQSGNSINTLQAFAKLKKEGCPLHIITDNRSIKEEQKTGVSYLDVQGEEIPFVTIGFDLTVLLLLAGALRAAGESFAMLEEAVKCAYESYEKGKHFYEENKEWLTNVKRIHICGAGTGQSIAQECALKFCETLQIAATAYETEEFLHGGFLELEENHAVFLIATKSVKGRTEELETYLPMLCRHVILVPNNPEIPEDLQTLCVVPFFQTVVALTNAGCGNPVPEMKEKYIEFEKKLKSKTVPYDEVKSNV